MKPVVMKKLKLLFFNFLEGIAHILPRFVDHTSQWGVAGQSDMVLVVVTISKYKLCQNSCLIGSLARKISELIWFSCINLHKFLLLVHQTVLSFSDGNVRITIY